MINNKNNNTKIKKKPLTYCGHLFLYQWLIQKNSWIIFPSTLLFLAVKIVLVRRGSDGSPATSTSSSPGPSHSSCPKVTSPQKCYQSLGKIWSFFVPQTDGGEEEQCGEYEQHDWERACGDRGRRRLPCSQTFGADEGEEEEEHPNEGGEQHQRLHGGWRRVHTASTKTRGAHGPSLHTPQGGFSRYLVLVIFVWFWSSCSSQRWRRRGTAWSSRASIWKAWQVVERHFQGLFLHCLFNLQIFVFSIGLSTYK